MAVPSLLRNRLVEGDEDDAPPHARRVVLNPGPVISNDEQLVCGWKSDVLLAVRHTTGEGVTAGQVFHPGISQSPILFSLVGIDHPPTLY